MKKVITIMLSLILAVFMLSNSVLATNELNVQPRYIACPDGGKHMMLSRGRGFVYVGGYPNTSNLTLDGYAFRCRGCGMVIISQYNPRYSGVIKLGKYFVGHYDSDIAYTGTAMWVKSKDDYLINNNLGTDDFTRGMEFIGSGV